jgi:2-keto-4-pentenoate hydratase/2-oxohepta-3-ene-1,7-dioic acid hydratase in catechol pathway
VIVKWKARKISTSSSSLAALAARQPFPEGLLKVGDVVRIEIERIGALENTVIEEPDGYLAPEAGA